MTTNSIGRRVWKSVCSRFFCMLQYIFLIMHFERAVIACYPSRAIALLCSCPCHVRVQLILDVCYVAERMKRMSIDWPGDKKIIYFSSNAQQHKQSDRKVGVVHGKWHSQIQPPFSCCIIILQVIRIATVNCGLNLSLCSSSGGGLLGLLLLCSLRGALLLFVLLVNYSAGELSFVCTHTSSFGIKELKI